MIETHYHIPAASQVLLVSGGEMLYPQNRICSYLGGTDTNPIFMFSTNIIESNPAKNPPPPWPSIEPGKYRIFFCPNSPYFPAFRVIWKRKRKKSREFSCLKLLQIQLLSGGSLLKTLTFLLTLPFAIFSPI